VVRIWYITVVSYCVLGKVLLWFVLYVFVVRIRCGCWWGWFCGICGVVGCVALCVLTINHVSFVFLLVVFYLFRFKCAFLVLHGGPTWLCFGFWSML